MGHIAFSLVIGWVTVSSRGSGSGAPAYAGRSSGLRTGSGSGGSSGGSRPSSRGSGDSQKFDPCCDYCRGSGKYTVQKSEQLRCTACGGSGGSYRQVPCTNCYKGKMSIKGPVGPKCNRTCTVNGPRRTCNTCFGLGHTTRVWTEEYICDCKGYY
ncbi:uncharacterized protein B0T15DRAFT_512990 [Chaetomium strumarium]|uniref:CR-type domain-containing protein n=1 Tax=Chaetomium strumarium TaxID=1170767 RepID=A0AAJ0M0X0_9PEZI|nr:hypothetical protein B0T15DRAFT_512990 [Chaetomium strumarium]